MNSPEITLMLQIVTDLFGTAFNAGLFMFFFMLTIYMAARVRQIYFAYIFACVPLILAQIKGYFDFKLGFPIFIILLSFGVGSALLGILKNK